MSRYTLLSSQNLGGLPTFGRFRQFFSQLRSVFVAIGFVI